MGSPAPPPGLPTHPTAPAPAPPLRVVLFYKYVALGDSVEAVAAWQRRLCTSLALSGRVRVAREGINGTLGGASADVDAYIARMESSCEFLDAAAGNSAPVFAGIDWKTSVAHAPPFRELLVRVARELVALELPPEQCALSDTGARLSPSAFRDAVQAAAHGGDEATAVIDVRNAYEYQLGHFAGALNPKTRRFGQFPAWAVAALPALRAKRQVLMYCTGGIRCEKASAFLRHLGVRGVSQLSGGIHRFLERFPDGGGVFVGKNFVFDERVAVAPAGSDAAAAAEAVAGRCERCAAPHDAFSGARCGYCRVHVLLCDACAAAVAPEDRFCEEHGALVAGDGAALRQRALALRTQLAAIVGRANKGKRRSLRKQIDTVERRIQRLAVDAQG